MGLEGGAEGEGRGADGEGDIREVRKRGGREGADEYLGVALEWNDGEGVALGWGPAGRAFGVFEAGVAVAPAEELGVLYPDFEGRQGGADVYDDHIKSIGGESALRWGDGDFRKRGRVAVGSHLAAGSVAHS